MKSNRLSAAIALAFVAGIPLAGHAQSLPAPTSGTLNVWFKAPLGGQAVSGTLSLDKCYVKGFAATRVDFFLGNTPLNSDRTMSDGMSCELDTTRFPNGTHTLRAVAYDASGRSYNERVNINISNTANTAPTVSITSPTANQSVTGALSYAATATDNAGVSRVEFKLDGTTISNDSSAPYAGSVATLAPGTHTLTATAYDAAGLNATSTVTFTVPQPNTPPTVSITSPTASQSVTGALSYAATASDNAGVSRVEFKLDGTTINSDTSAPYGGSIATLTPGNHTLTATAYDAAGLNATSTVTFTVPQPNTAPTVSITSPTANQSISGGNVSYAATATDDAGVSRVEFKLDGSVVSSDTAAPFSGTLSNIAPGTHTLTATAYDAAGLNTTSTVSFSVPQPSTGGGGTTLPAPTAGSLDVWFKAPLSSATVSGTLALDKCYVKGIGVTRVDFFVDGRSVGSDNAVADGMSCTIDTTTLSNGTHQLMATAYASNGSKRSDVININVQNTSGGGGGGTGNAAPTVSITSPTANQSVTGALSYAANATDDAGVSRVEFKLDGTVVGNDTSAPFGGSIATLTPGTHTLTATAFDAAGLSSASTVTFTVPGSSGGGGGSVSNLPNGGSAVATFHSLGLTWKPASNPGATGCIVQYKPTSESAWKQGLNMWYDSRSADCRGSLVQLQPGTEYEVQFGTGSTFTHKVVASTWSEQFPIAQTITLPAGTTSQPVNITTGGSATGYVLYQAHPNGTTIDVANAQDNNFRISAPYVIVRGVTMKGARTNAVELRSGAHHVVIENNDISEWGRYRTTASGVQVGIDMDSGVRAICGNSMAMSSFVIQRNRIRNPRYSANSWTNGHPAGPQAVTLSYCGGNHVIRYNDMANTTGKKFNDAIGGEDNFTQAGAPHSDSDIYGNLIVGAWDDGIEAEGSNRNVRIWGNYIDDTAIGIASTVTHHGPVYIFRNVYNRSRKLLGSPDGDDRGPMFKAGSGGSSAGDGRRYVFHNTALQPDVGGSYPGGAGIGISGNSGEPLTNTVTRNNIFQVWRDNWTSVSQTSSGFGNDVNYDLYNGSISAGTGAESNGTKAKPVYVPGAGGATGVYQLQSSSPGFGKGAKLNNFNDDASAPDVGAHQSGKPPMKFGIQ
jgi:hypothetical protein